MNFHYLLMSGHAIYLKQLMAQLNHTGLTPGQPKVLDYLMAHDGANQREIADACHIEAATLTSVLNGMEAKSLIERRRTDGDRRSFYIYLTGSGKEMGQKVTEAFPDWKRIHSGISRLKGTGIYGTVPGTIFKNAAEF